MILDDIVELELADRDPCDAFRDETAVQSINAGRNAFSDSLRNSS